MKNKSSLSKAARFLFIASLCSGSAVTHVMHASRSDVNEESGLAMRGQDSGALPINDDLPSLPSRLVFENAKIEADEVLLTAKERKQLAHELAAYRAKVNPCRALVIAGFWGETV